VKGRKDQLVPFFADIPANPGEMAVPSPIENANIQNARDAINAFNNGTPLNKIPQQYWHTVVSENAKLPPGQRKWKEVAKQGGAIKELKIFQIVDANDQVLHHGIVFNREHANFYGGANEIFAQNIGVALGLDMGPARFDGKVQGEEGNFAAQVWAAMPFAFNYGPDGRRVVVPNGLRQYHASDLQALVDKGVRERFGHFLFNAALAIPDRHVGNGMVDIIDRPDGQRVPHIVPIDMGWYGRAGVQSIEAYQTIFSMDSSILSDIKRIKQDPNLTAEQKQKIAEDIQSIFNNMHDRIKVLIADRQKMIDDFKKTADLDRYQQIYGWTDAERDAYERRVENSANTMYDTLIQADSQFTAFAPVLANYLA
jgi:hypothetical protein